MAEQIPMTVKPYGVAIQQAIATGDLGRMREAKAQAEQWLADQDGLRTALQALQAEIARLEQRKP